MIPVSPDFMLALAQKTLALKLRIFWHLEGGGIDSSGNPIRLDVTDRVQNVSNIERNIAPFLNGFSISDCTITLRNNDGKFTRSGPQSYLRTGPKRYQMTKVTIEQGIRILSGEFEYVPVFSGRVQWVRFIQNQIELKIISNYTLLRSFPMPEEYQFGMVQSNASPNALAANFANIITSFSALTLDDIDTAGLDYLFTTGIEEPSGWLMTGMIPQGTPISSALDDFARSLLCTPIETEAGKITFVPEVWPRIWCQLQQGSASFPMTLDKTNMSSLEIVDGLFTTATEVIVHYQGTSMRYRATADEVGVGRISRSISCPFMTHGHTAGWAARVIYEHFKQFPLVASFTTFGHGLIAQLNDRVTFVHPETGVKYKGRIVSKIWAKATVTLGLIVSPAEDLVFGSNFPIVNVSNWDTGTLL